MWSYIREHDVPYNALHDRGFVSIGCEPCTRPVNPGQHEREGRWWWEEETKKECGLHVGNLKADLKVLDPPDIVHIDRLNFLLAVVVAPSRSRTSCSTLV